MNSAIRNILILGISVLFIITFWIIGEIWRAYGILEELNDPQTATERGFNSAEIDFTEGVARFKHWNREIPSVSKWEIENKFKEYKPLTFFHCTVYGKSGFEQIALNISELKYNQYYVTAYNRRLKTILENEDQI